MYAVHVLRHGQPDLLVRGTDLGKLHKIGMRKVRQHLSRQIALLLRVVDAGLADPLNLGLASEIAMSRDPWGGVLKYRGRIVSDDWYASYHISVD